jgi:hypothetical protein
MDKSIWSDSIWKTFHYVALGLPQNPSPQDKLNYKNFYENLGKVLPCNDCATHYQKNFANIPIDEYLDNPDKLFEWTVKFHNYVNQFTKHPIISVDDAKKLYLKTQQVSSCSFNYCSFGIITVLLLLLLLQFSKTIKCKIIKK